MKRVLFVDDDSNVVKGLRRLLRSVRHEWKVESATSGLAALEAFEREPFDIIVSDMKMPGMDGAELLTRVKTLHPGSIRIILSGHSEREAILKSISPAHQYLSKPCEAGTMKETIERAYAFRSLLGNSDLKELVSQIESLPSIPSLYREITGEISAPNPSIATIAKIINQDIGMSANVLKLVNSAYFGVFDPATSVERAVNHLGIETIQDLLRIHIFAEYKGPEKPGFSLEALRRHSLLTATFARIVAGEEEHDSKLIEYAFQAGMLHDVGKLVLAATIPQRYSQVLQRSVARGASTSDTERQELGATHAEIGAYLIGLWGLPQPVVEAVAYHARPTACPQTSFGVLAVVHVADRLALETESASTATHISHVDLEYLKLLGLEHRLQAWRDACLKQAA